MRVRSRFSEERGATAVMFVILLVVFVAVLGLATDGGLLFVRYRQVRRANDAAALAAAINCVKFESQGIAGANAAAGNYAQQNGANPIPWQDNVYEDNTCVAASGKVTVYYGASQSLSFGPAIGIGSPKQVTASATASWGAAGSVGRIIPLTVAQGTDLTNCTVAPDGTQPALGAECKLWWDNGDSLNGKWGVIDTRQLYWGMDGTASGCNSNSSASLVEGWMDGVSGSWFTSNPTPPYPYVWVCAGDGNQGDKLTSAINDRAAYPHQDIVYLPVFDPTHNVTLSGAVYKYAVIGFAGLRIVESAKGNAAETLCNKPTTGGGDVRCLVASWQGFQTGGFTPDGDNDFGLKAVALTG